MGLIYKQENNQYAGEINDNKNLTRKQALEMLRRKKKKGAFALVGDEIDYNEPITICRYPTCSANRRFI